MSSSTKLALLEEFATVARALGNPHRLRILEQLGQGECGVEGIAAKVELSVANCSQHLQSLRRAGLVTARRDGKAMIYRLTDTDTIRLMESLHRVASNNLAEVQRLLAEVAEDGAAPRVMARTDLEKRLASGAVTLIDVRPLDEYAVAHLPGAQNVPLDQLDEFIANFGGDAGGGELVAYCRGPYCLYSHRAVAALRARGIPAVAMQGGLPDWMAEGRRVEQGSQTKSG